MAEHASAMPDETQAIAMLRILLATCETTLQTLQAADNPIDRTLVLDLERMVERTHAELAKLLGDGSSNRAH